MADETFAFSEPPDLKEPQKGGDNKERIRSRANSVSARRGCAGVRLVLSANFAQVPAADRTHHRRLAEGGNECARCWEPCLSCRETLSSIQLRGCAIGLLLHCTSTCSSPSADALAWTWLSVEAYRNGAVCRFLHADVPGLPSHSKARASAHTSERLHHHQIRP
jgi:hypothetical protein